MKTLLDEWNELSLLNTFAVAVIHFLSSGGEQSQRVQYNKHLMAFASHYVAEKLGHIYYLTVMVFTVNLQINLR